MKDTIKKSLLRDLSSIKAYAKEDDVIFRKQNGITEPSIEEEELFSNDELFLKILLSCYDKEFLSENIFYLPYTNLLDPYVSINPMEKFRQKRLLRNLLLSDFKLVFVPNNEKKVWEAEFVEALHEFEVFLKKKDELKELIAEINESKDLLQNK